MPAAQRAMVIEVRVKTRARVSALEATPEGSYLAQLKSAPVDGRANAELIELVARHFGCRKSAVSIKSGAASRTKRVLIDAA